MIRFTQGNLLDSDAEGLVNTVNTVGVMGKGVALMFKEAYPENFKAYEDACRAKQIQVGKMFVTERQQMFGPKWIINFPTKAHWRFPSKMEWIVQGLDDLKHIIQEKEVLADLPGVDVIVYEPTAKYQNVAKRTGLEK